MIDVTCIDNAFPVKTQIRKEAIRKLSKSSEGTVVYLENSYFKYNITVRESIEYIESKMEGNDEGSVEKGG